MSDAAPEPELTTAQPKPQTEQLLQQVIAVIDAARQPDAVWNEIRTCLEERFGP